MAKKRVLPVPAPLSVRSQMGKILRQKMMARSLWKDCLVGLPHGDLSGTLTNCTWTWQDMVVGSFRSSHMGYFVPLFIAATAFPSLPWGCVCCHTPALPHPHCLMLSISSYLPAWGLYAYLPCPLLATQGIACPVAFSKQLRVPFFHSALLSC